MCICKILLQFEKIVLGSQLLFIEVVGFYVFCLTVSVNFWLSVLGIVYTSFLPQSSAVAVVSLAFSSNVIFILIAKLKEFY